MSSIAPNDDLNTPYDSLLVASIALPAFPYTPPSSSPPRKHPSIINHWSKHKPIQTFCSVYLNLTPGYLDACAEGDDVTKSVHYGLLTKRVTSMVKDVASGKKGDKGGDAEGFYNPDHLIRRSAAHAFEMGGADAREVKVLLNMPQFILLAEGFEIDAIVGLPSSSVSPASTSTPASPLPKITQKLVHVKDLSIPVIIGVNPPERLSKQRVIVNLTFSEILDGAEGTGEEEEVDYKAIVNEIYETISQTTYLTLEAFVIHVAKIALAGDKKVGSVKARAQKPSALSFAGSSGVEVRRVRV